VLARNIANKTGLYKVERFVKTLVKMPSHGTFPALATQTKRGEKSFWGGGGRFTATTTPNPERR
jgi:hypothetical protein